MRTLSRPDLVNNEPVECDKKDDEHSDVKGHNLRITDPFMEVKAAFSCAGHGVSKFCNGVVRH